MTWSCAAAPGAVVAYVDNECAALIRRPERHLDRRALRRIAHGVSRDVLHGLAKQPLGRGSDLVQYTDDRLDPAEANEGEGGRHGPFGAPRLVAQDGKC